MWGQERFQVCVTITLSERVSGLRFVKYDNLGEPGLGLRIVTHGSGKHPENCGLDRLSGVRDFAVTG